MTDLVSACYRVYCTRVQYCDQHTLVTVRCVIFAIHVYFVHSTDNGVVVVPPSRTTSIHKFALC